MDENMKNRIVPASLREVSIDADYHRWMADVKTRYRQSQIKASLSVNNFLMEFYWSLGHDIMEIRKAHKWGSGIMDQISLDLKAEFPGEKGFSTQNLYRMAKFYSFYSGEEVLFSQAVRKLQLLDNEWNINFSQLVRKMEPSGFPTVLGMIPWGHHAKIFYHANSIEEALFYIVKTIQKGWSRDMLSHAIGLGMYETENKPVDNFELTLPKPQSGLAKDLHKSTLNFGFVSLEEGYAENALRHQLVANLKRFLLEMGPDFFLKGEEVEVVVGGESGSIDLLLYNLALKCYFAIELKTRAFKPQDVGQLSFYVTAVDKLIKRPKDNPTVGIIICKGVNKVKTQWTLEGIRKPIGVSTYTDNLIRKVEEHLDALPVVAKGREKQKREYVKK
jgi:predicted nuclease of restriction endonuclease-like (RecB) superfamily